MDASSCSPFPHYTWFAHWLAVRPPRVFDVYECRHVSHRVLLTTEGIADVGWTTHGVETSFHTTKGSIGFFPCDGDRHVMSITTADGMRAYDVLIPEEHMGRVRLSEGVPTASRFSAVPVFRDTLLEASLLRLSQVVGRGQLSEDIGDEIAARQILLRLCFLMGGRRPDWHKDTSVFASAVMRRIVAHIDAHLGVAMSLESISGTVLLSPGHFARKFQHSVGLSLDRFLNNRRINAAFVLLREASTPLSQVALDLGFSSQSHFTRVFSGLTGMTPQQYRRVHLRMDA